MVTVTSYNIRNGVIIMILKTTYLGKLGDYDSGYEYKMKCDYCGKEFKSSNERKKYCCENCTNQGGVKNRKEKKAQARKRKCLLCGETFIPPRNDAKYCTDKCKQAAYRERKKDKQVGNCPFILQIGKLHKRLLDTFDNYDIAGYHIADIVQAIPFKENETRFIVKESGEILRTWDKPFENNYSFENRYTQLTPDMMICFCDMSISDYDLKSKKGIKFMAELKRETEASDKETLAEKVQ